MTTIQLKQFGKVLTGREFGADVMKGLALKISYPVCLDFEGVEAIGSSFGDEVIPILAKAQNNRLSVKNANETVRSILKDVALDAGITLEWQ